MGRKRTHSQFPRGLGEKLVVPVAQYEGTIDHLTSGRPILAKNEHITRRDGVRTRQH